MTIPTQKLKDHSTELRDELLSKTEEARKLVEALRYALAYPGSPAQYERGLALLRSLGEIK